VSTIKSVMPASALLPITRIVDNISELRPGTEADSYRYLDPKQVLCCLLWKSVRLCRIADRGG